MTGLLRLLHLRHVRRRPMRAVLTALSLAAGVALAMSVLIVRTSFDRSVTSFGRTLAGPAPLRVIGPASRGGLDAHVLDTVRHVDGVGTATPLVQAVTIADGIGGRSELVAALGVECGTTTSFGTLPCPSDARTTTPPPVVSTWLARHRGAAASLRTDVTAVRLAAAPASALLDGVNRGRTVVYPLPVAQRLFAREGALDVIYVTPAKGTSIDGLGARLAQAVGPQNGVLGATDPPPGVAIALTFSLALLGMLSLFALGIGGMLARNTVVLSLLERRRDFAVAAAVGATPGVLTTALLVEVAGLGAVGGLLGAGGGVLLARSILAGMDRFASRTIGAHLSVHVDTAIVAASVVVGVAAAVVATWRPARRAARLDVAAELLGRDTGTEAAAAPNVRRGLVLIAIGMAGLVLCRASAAHGGLDPWQPIGAQLGMLVAALGFTGAVGGFAPVVAGALGRVLTGAPGPVRLGVANLARSRRTGVMAVAVAAAVGVAFSIASFTRSVHDSVSADIASGGRDRISINTVPVSNSINIDGKPWPSTIDALARIPGVVAVDRSVALLVRQPDGSSIGAVATEGDNALHLDGDLVRGTADLDKFQQGEVVVGPALARRHHLHPGDHLTVAGRTGVVDLTVQGVEQFGDFGGSRVIMPMSLLTQLYGPQPPSSVSVKVAPGTDIDTVARAIEHAHLQPQLDAETPDEITATISKEFTSQIQPFWALQRALVIVSFVAVLFTLLLSAIQRRRELGVLGAVGMRPGEVASMMLAEGATVGLTGAVLGTIGSIGFIIPMGYTTAVVIGFSDQVRFDVGAPFAWGALSVVVVLVAASWPAWRAARTEVLPALQYE